MNAECCLLFDERLLYVRSRIHMLQAMVCRVFALDSYPNVLDLVVRDFVWKT